MNDREIRSSIRAFNKLVDMAASINATSLVERLNGIIEAMPSIDRSDSQSLWIKPAMRFIVNQLQNDNDRAVRLYEILYQSLVNVDVPSSSVSSSLLYHAESLYADFVEARLNRGIRGAERNLLTHLNGMRINEYLDLKERLEAILREEVDSIIVESSGSSDSKPEIETGPPHENKF